MKCYSLLCNMRNNCLNLVFHKPPAPALNTFVRFFLSLLILCCLFKLSFIPFEVLVVLLVFLRKTTVRLLFPSLPVLSHHLLFLFCFWGFLAILSTS